MRISDEHYEMMLSQIELDCNLTEAIKIKDDMWIAPSVQLPGSRIIDKLDPFFRVIVYMGVAYIMADEETIPGWMEILKYYPAEWFFNYGRLRKIDGILGEFGREIIDTHLFYLPDADAKIMEIPKDYKRLTEEEIISVKEREVFHNAFAYSPTQPDVMAIGMPDGKGFYKAMAAASEDGKYVRQIGIDVLPEYEGEGLGTGLTTAMKQIILKEGYLPFYGTSESHAISRMVASKSGFLPAFTELFVGKIDPKMGGIYD